ncbi:MAG: DEAD/DEAH box helicase [bacterium]
MIPRYLAAAFPPPVQARGDAYFRRGVVRIARATSTRITAFVRGTTSYVVIIDASAGVLALTCTCPYAAEYGRCKHMWAVLLYANAQRMLASVTATAGPEALVVATSDDALGDDDGPLEYDDVDDLIEDMFPETRVTVTQDARPPAPQPYTPLRTSSAPPPLWRSVLNTLERQMSNPVEPASMRSTTWHDDRRLVYVVDLPLSAQSAGLVMEVASEREVRPGEWDPPVQFRGDPDAWQLVPDPVDQQIAQMLLGAQTTDMYGRQPRGTRFILRSPALGTTLRLICDTGRCRVRHVAGERPVQPVAWDDGPAWQIRLRISATTPPGHMATLELVRPDETMPIKEPAQLHRDGFLFVRNAFSRVDYGRAWPFVVHFRERPSIAIGPDELPRFLESLFAMHRAPAVALPAEIGIVELHDPPVPCVSILPDPITWRKTQNELALSFRYGKRRVPDGDTAKQIFDASVPALRHRDLATESAARNTLLSLGAKEEMTRGTNETTLSISAKKLGALIVALVGEGWHVDTAGVPVRAPGVTRASVRSGIDWFELDAGVRYGELEVSLHDLLVARRAGGNTIVLADGSHGLLPLDWLAKLGPIAAGSTMVNGSMRYGRSQLALLDALLATVPDPDVDATFNKARTELRRFERIEPADPTGTFTGTLRAYQREGLGWLHFLRTFGLGGCLADDMGLGKTVQVLALLESRRVRRTKPRKPSIVVVPRSLVFNWIREAERFTPRMRVLDHSGVSRSVASIDGSAIDLVVTTYGTLRRDAALLTGVEFDYAILDEAQAVKNASSVSAKAVRLLKADHRLAMTGTPIENRLEELWSLFEFLNPGMLGSASAFAGLVRLAGADESTGGRDVLASALRPVILRRTKEQVASDLPARVEQTLTVTLEGPQRKFYDGLLESYRRSVLERVDRDGVQKARMHILEALLRLRQAACHPGLADPHWTDAPSAKLDALMPAIAEVIAQGHKVLVFSQFTTFLAHVRRRLDETGTTYEYLDGAVRNRQARVDRFQNDAACPVFLISLKAGGHGLNLTAADYVYLLDPWWNPAVEAQAIDRAHRIGQTRHVMATRIVARDTIEEKILELQASKRALADAILGQDQGVLAQIGRAELEMLLG